MANLGRTDADKMKTKTLIVAATAAELSGLYHHFRLAQGRFVQTDGFDILLTGVGMTATAYALGRHLSEAYGLVLNLGIAGCFDHSIPLGTVLNVTSDEFAELGAEDHHNFIRIDDLGFGRSRFSATCQIIHPLIKRLPAVSGITVNCVHGHAASIAAIKERLAPVTESMEGAAVFYACAEAGLPCLQVRAVSNYVEPRNRSAWQIGPALEKLNDWAIRFLTKS